MPHMVPSISDPELCFWAFFGRPGRPPNFAGCLSEKKARPSKMEEPFLPFGKPGSEKSLKLKPKGLLAPEAGICWDAGLININKP